MIHQFQSESVTSSRTTGKKTNRWVHQDTMLKNLMSNLHLIVYAKYNIMICLLSSNMEIIQINIFLLFDLMKYVEKIQNQILIHNTKKY